LKLSVAVTHKVLEQAGEDLVRGGFEGPVISSDGRSFMTLNPYLYFLPPQWFISYVINRIITRHP
jgi:hypothetical protein